MKQSTMSAVADSTRALEAKLREYHHAIEARIVQHAKGLGGQGKLQEACEYALLNGGKRFRPALVFMIAEALGKNLDVTNQAIAIEYFHTASLIADDLPCMDDDDERRNKPSVHKVYGEAIALLASYALIAAGYGALADLSPSCVKAEIGPQEIVLALENATYNTGLTGATGGQYLDLFPPDLQESTLREILHKKTVSLFEISFVFGWLYGGGDVAKLPLVKRCASHFGMAFQIADDIGDVEQDKKNGRLVNMANVFGIDAAKEMLSAELKGFHSVMERLGIFSEPLEALALRLAMAL